MLLLHRATSLQGFAHDLFPVYMEDDDALLRASHAAWVLQPVTGEAWRCGSVGWGGRRAAGEKRCLDDSCFGRCEPCVGVDCAAQLHSRALASSAAMA